MTKVDFYILDQGSVREKEHFACRLAEKAYRLKNRIYIHAQNADHCRRLDDLLWTWRDGSFLPHGLASDAAGSSKDSDLPNPSLPDPILIGDQNEPPDISDLLINLITDVPTLFSRFDRVVEIVSADPEGKQAGRDRYRFYRDRGYALNQHNIQL